MEKCLIVAAADNNAIGVRGDLPWHISEDLKYFKRVTHGYPVIMGRTTYESIGRPLPGRKNIVLTSRGELHPSVTCVRSLEEAYVAAEPSDKCFVIGGASVYAAVIYSVDRLYLTKVHTVIEDADAFFPVLDLSVWHLESKSETFTDEETGFEFEFLVYVRK